MQRLIIAAALTFSLWTGKPAMAYFQPVDCYWNYYTHEFLVVYYSHDYGIWHYAFEWHCPLWVGATRDDDAGLDPAGAASPAYTDQEAYGNVPGGYQGAHGDEGISGQTTESTETSGGGFSGDIGGEAGCCQ